MMNIDYKQKEQPGQTAMLRNHHQKLLSRFEGTIFEYSREFSGAKLLSRFEGTIFEYSREFSGAVGLK